MLELAPERTDPRGGKNVDVARGGRGSLLPGKHAWPYTGPRPPGWWWCPRQDSNLRTRLRRPVLYPLSYEGGPTQHTLAAAA